MENSLNCLNLSYLFFNSPRYVAEVEIKKKATR